MSALAVYSHVVPATNAATDKVVIFVVAPVPEETTASTVVVAVSGVVMAIQPGSAENGVALLSLATIEDAASRLLPSTLATLPRQLTSWTLSTPGTVRISGAVSMPTGKSTRFASVVTAPLAYADAGRPPSCVALVAVCAFTALVALVAVWALVAVCALVAVRTLAAVPPTARDRAS